MQRMSLRLSAVLLSVIGLLLAGCGARQPIRHLSSDVCLITPNLTRQEVTSLLGPPDNKQINAENQEVWLYYQVNKSLLRKTPYMGDTLGTVDYDLVTITFAGEQVRTCVYRSLSEQELRESGLSGVVVREQLGDQ